MGNLKAFNNQLYFTAATYKYGTELYTGSLPSAPIPIYIFTGNGNFNDPANWDKNQVPPSEIPQGVELIINPPAGGECILNVPLTIQGGKLTIKQGAKFRVL